MILETYYGLAEAIMNITGVQSIDLDKGQLEAPEQFESILQPGILINLPDIQYQQLTAGKQYADMNFSLKTVVRLPNHTHIYAGASVLKPDNLAELLIEDAVHQAIVKLPGCVRTATKSYPVLTWYVVEHFYQVPGNYTPEPRYQPHILGQLPNISTLLKLPLS